MGTEVVLGSTGSKIEIAQIETGCHNRYLRQAEAQSYGNSHEPRSTRL